jgi:endonuclease YncB( thermonuclease family)
VVRVVDADTLQFVVDLGYYAYAEHRMRLLGVDTPEMNARDAATRARAVAATEFTTQWVALHIQHSDDVEWPVNVRSQKADSFGRFLAHLECGQGHSLNQELLDAGHAIPFRG